MKISDVKVRLIHKDDGRLRGVASVVIEDCFVVHDIKIIEGNDGTFIAMPSKKAPDGTYKDIAHPLNMDTRQQLSDTVLYAYNKTLAEADTASGPTDDAPN